jgi:hypothetical protein
MRCHDASQDLGAKVSVGPPLEYGSATLRICQETPAPLTRLGLQGGVGRQPHPRPLSQVLGARR